MFPSWRMQLGEARRALRAGRLDQACAIVARDSLQEFRQTRELSAELVEHVAQRAEDRLAAGHSSAGWNDLRLAQKMAGADEPIAHLREGYRQELLDRAMRLLSEGRTAAAQQELAKLERRKLANAQVRELQEFATSIEQAEALLANGKAAEALQNLTRPATNLRPEAGTIDSSLLVARVEALRNDCEQHLCESGDLLEATQASDWHRMLATADRLLAIAPRDRVARAARRRAWKAVGLDATQAYRGAGLPVTPLSLRETERGASPRSSTSGTDDTMSAAQTPNRFMLWVDAVGGFLVCQDDQVVLGQPSSGSQIALPICADLSRRHAVIRREGGAYTIDPLGDVSVDGRKLTGPMLLGSKHEIQLGEAVRLRFEKPHALSATARLTPLSGHRTEPQADTVLLMADSCVMGPKSHSHILCRKWPGDVMMFRQHGKLQCRSSMSMTVDGEAAQGPAPLECGARIEGEDFAISLEDV